MFWSFPLCSCGVGYCQSRMTLNGNLKGRDTKNGFSFADSHLSCRKFSWPEDFPFSFFHGSRIILFASDLFHLYFLPLFGRESSFFFLFYCSFLYFHLFFPFLSFYFFLFFLFSSPSSFLSLGNRVLAFYSLSLEEIPLPFASGERMRILWIGQGSTNCKVVSQ